MNKRITSILLSVVLIVSMFAVYQRYRHTLSDVTALPSGLIAGGVPPPAPHPASGREHYKCSNCGELYEDVSANEVIEDRDSVVIDARGHDYIVRITDEAHKRSHCRRLP